MSVEISEDSLKKLLKMHVDAQELLTKIPEYLDDGKESEISRNIGAELEARLQMMHEAEKQDFAISKKLDEIMSGNETKLEELEKEILN
jgi:hypothetical protein